MLYLSFLYNGIQNLILSQIPLLNLCFSCFSAQSYLLLSLIMYVMILCLFSLLLFLHHLCLRIPLNPSCLLMYSVIPTSDSFTIALAQASESSFLFPLNRPVICFSVEFSISDAGIVPETEKTRSLKFFIGAPPHGCDLTGALVVDDNDSKSSLFTHCLLTFLSSYDIVHT